MYVRRVVLLNSTKRVEDSHANPRQDALTHSRSGGSESTTGTGAEALLLMWLSAVGSITRRHSDLSSRAWLGPSGPGLTYFSPSYTTCMYTPSLHVPRSPPPRSLAHSLTPLLTYLLTHSLTRSPTHSLHSLITGLSPPPPTSSHPTPTAPSPNGPSLCRHLLE